jgi:hypothetical protein
MLIIKFMVYRICLNHYSIITHGFETLKWILLVLKEQWAGLFQDSSRMQRRVKEITYKRRKEVQMYK